MATTALTTYLNDHLGGSAAAVQLLDRLIDDAGTPENAKFFSGLRAEIEEDRATLEDLLRRLGGSPSGLREWGGWLAAKVTGLKLKIDDPDSGTLERLEAIEALVLGIHGKSRLWRSLAAVAPAVPELQTLDLKALEKRADDQHARTEARRLEAARLALARSAPGK
jgi:hypothetical protein